MTCVVCSLESRRVKSRFENWPDEYRAGPPPYEVCDRPSHVAFAAALEQSYRKEFPEYPPTQGGDTPQSL